MRIQKGVNQIRFACGVLFRYQADLAMNSVGSNMH